MLEITPSGSAAIEQALAPQLLQISGLFAVLAPADKDKLLAALGALADAIEANEMSARLISVVRAGTQNCRSPGVDDGGG